MTLAKGTRAAPATRVPTPRSPSNRPLGKRPRRRTRGNRIAYLLIGPMVLLLGVFAIYPLLYAVYLSTYELSFYLDPEFVGLQFYEDVITSKHFWNAVWVGIKLAVLVVPPLMVLSFLIASLIKSVGRRLASFLKTTIYIPTVVSAVVTAIVFGFMYRVDGGLINGVMAWFGAAPVTFLADPGRALPAIAAPAIWMGVGVSTLIMLAGMLDIPESYYEAARLEGANGFQQMVHITVPLMKNVILFLFVTGTIGAIQQVELPLLMTGGGPLDATMTPNLYIFNQFRNPTPYSTSYSLTAALLLLVVLGGVTALIFRLIRSEKAVDG